MDTRDRILTRLKAAQEKRGNITIQQPDFEDPIYHQVSDSLELEFKKNLELVGGKVILCSSKDDIIHEVKQICSEKGNRIYCLDPDLQNILQDEITIDSDEDSFLNLSVGITGCEFLVAHLGSVIISSAQFSGRRLNVFPETHVVIAHTSQLTDYLDTAFEKLREKYKNKIPSLISTITGPSRTADIEKTLIMGMHGPRSLIIILSNEPIK
jgi:L-lactate dehydrogenase complex protein LldG